MATDPPISENSSMSRRERQIMDVIYARGQATAMQIYQDLPDPSSYAAVRGLIHVMQKKGYLRSRRQGPRNVYLPRRQRRTAGRAAMKRALDVFFGGDVPVAVAALLQASDANLTDQQIQRLRKLIEQARQRES